MSENKQLFPAFMFHDTLPARKVLTQAELDALGAGWQDHPVTDEEREAHAAAKKPAKKKAEPEPDPEPEPEDVPDDKNDAPPADDEDIPETDEKARELYAAQPMRLVNQIKRAKDVATLKEGLAYEQVNPNGPRKSIVAAFEARLEQLQAEDESAKA